MKGGGGDDNEIPLREKGKADMHTRQGGRLDPRGGDQPVQPPQWTHETKRTHKRAESDSLSTLPATVSRLPAPPPSQKPPSALY